MLKYMCAVVIVCLLYNEAMAGKKKRKFCCNGPNESYSDEKASCPPDTCVSLVARYDCTNTTIWPAPAPGCVCDSGYRRPAAGEDCVKTCECPQMKNSPDCQPKCEEDDDDDDE